jgi:hypothetical protein
LGYLEVALTAICFANCQNVTTTEHHQPRQQRRAAERAGRPPLVTFRTIDIGPVTRILREEGQVETTGLGRALHLCRPHWKHYRAGTYMGRKDAPAMTFRVPLHTRGSLQRGVVLKDYRVLRDKEEPA